MARWFDHRMGRQQLFCFQFPGLNPYAGGLPGVAVDPVAWSNRHRQVVGIQLRFRPRNGDKNGIPRFPLPEEVGCIWGTSVSYHLRILCSKKVRLNLWFQSVGSKVQRSMVQRLNKKNIGQKAEGIVK